MNRYRYLMIIGSAMSLLVAGGLQAQEAPPAEGLVRMKADAPVITVGGPGADLSEFTTRAIQVAVDAVATSSNRPAARTRIGGMGMSFRSGPLKCGHSTHGAPIERTNRPGLQVGTCFFDIPWV